MEFFRWITSSKLIIKTTILVMLSLLIVGGYFIEAELKSNQSHYLETVDIQQGYFVDQLARHLQCMLETDPNTNTDALAEYLSKKVEASGSRWVFLAVGSKVVFAKNISTTKSLGENEYWYKFIKYSEAQEDMLVKYTSFEHDYKTYIIGMASSKSAVLTEGFIPKHNLYMIMTIGSLTLSLVSLTLIAMTIANGIRKKLTIAEDELIAKNNQIEQLLVEITHKQEDIPGNDQEALRKQIYDEDLLRGFLQKSDDPSLLPLCMMDICLIMGNKYYTKNQIFSYIEPVRVLLSPRHILAEVSRGEFIAILYRTDFEEASLLREKIRTAWDQHNIPQGAKIGVGIIEIDTAKETALQAYDNFIAEIKKARQGPGAIESAEEKNEI